MSDRVSTLRSELTLDEAVSLVHGDVDPDGEATGYVPGVERLGVPPLRLVDGPLGVRVPGGRATAFPASLALAATFDPAIAREQGAAMGREAAAYGQDVLLGPGANLVRVPHCGRNFEYLSEDPVHSSAFARAVVEGVQSEGVMACVKHYVTNNQETDRATVDVRVDERTLRELYLPPFRAAVDAGAAAVMSAYNTVGGTPMSEHRRLLRDVLKGEWGFEGFVVSDWFGTRDAVRSANGGLDVEMPGVDAETYARLVAGRGETIDGDVDPDLFSDVDGGMPDPTETARFETELADAVAAGDVPRERLDDMVGRVLGRMEAFGRLDAGADDDAPDGALDTPEHRRLAERVAVRGTVLLENDGVLPLDDDADVALVGPNVDRALVGGGGSSEVSPAARTSPLDGVTARAAGEVAVARGHPRVRDASMFEGEAADDDPADHRDDGEVRSVDDAVAEARGADVAVVLVRDRATEARDRPDLRLPGEQDELVEAVAAAADRTVVVVNSSGPVELPWRDDCAAVVENWYPGQAHGDALAAVLYGDSDPGGRLPVSFAAESDYPTAAPERFPGTDGTVEYGEGRLVGYRHFEATEREAVYPFGHGRSYAEFAYRDAEPVDGSTVRVTVENTSSRAGREVVQAYVRPAERDDGDGGERGGGGAEGGGDHRTDGEARPTGETHPSGAARPDDEPVRELAGFAAVRIPAGETETVDVDLADLAFERYGEDGWEAAEGPFVVDVARSAADTRLSVDLRRRERPSP